MTYCGTRVAIISLTAALACGLCTLVPERARAAGRQPRLPDAVETLADPPGEYSESARRDSVRTLLFAYMPPDYLHDNARRFADMGVSGLMLGSLMYAWDTDVWRLPNGWNTPPARPVRGEGNALFESCRRMNARCREVGITDNSIKVAFYRELPDWFDDAGWDTLCERFRQCAIFARDAGFAGVALDYEYIRHQYRLDWTGYDGSGRAERELRAQARARGYQMMCAMLDEFPGMKNWRLPEPFHGQGPLIAEFFIGEMQALAERDAPGGMHVGIEGYYKETNAAEMVRGTHFADCAALAVLSDPSVAGSAVVDYWRRRGTIMPGLWPLGYYRELRDRAGNVTGYEGKSGLLDPSVGSYGDKSANYSAREFRRQLAAARAISRRYVWLYCHGSVLWRMSREEYTRYRGVSSDTLPLDPNIAEFERVLSERLDFNDDAFCRVTEAMRARRYGNAGWGTCEHWWVLKPFPIARGASAVDMLRSDAPPDPADLARSRWESVDVPASRYVNLAGWLAQDDSAFAYAVAELESDEERDAYLLFGSNGLDRIWVNDRLVHEVAGERWPREDSDRVRVHIPEGRSRIVIKSGAARVLWGFFTWWGFYLRIADGAGNAVPGVRWVEPAPEDRLDASGLPVMPAPERPASRSQ